MEIAIARDYDADWAGLYVDGQLVQTGHLDTIDEEALRLLNVATYTTHTGSYNGDRHGGFPSALADINGAEE